ncbi:MAG: tRNA 2-selenouridine(34) synthase MnmH [Anaerophaga sp.]|nr:tRNA 2-selenouridine(34) synthase MnmH [Anaerophaga sp.]
MANSLSPYEFLKASEKYPVVDVRTPSEYAKGHIPGAVNLPLFSDEERAVVGTIYKKQGRNHAILKGLEFVGPVMSQMAKKALELAVEGKLFVHCWRGGMRSASMAWLFETVGIDTYLLEGGYKAYRASFREMLKQGKWNFIVLGGPTGSGKTDVLKALADQGEQVLDLEGLANHKGSAFGALGQKKQPTSEQFENDIHDVLRHFDPERFIWVEGESHNIGRVFIPDMLFGILMDSPLVMFELEREKRLDRLVKEYGCFGKELLAQSVKKIEKRLGGLRTKEALEALDCGNYRKVADITLQYYDKGYTNSLAKRKKPFLVIKENEDKPDASAVKIKSKLSYAYNRYQRETLS